MKQYIKNEFRKYNIELNQLQLDKFENYLNYLLEENAKFNLTAITDKKQIVVKHFIDSILPYDIFKKDANVVDIGAGAGFPSVPLMILRPDLRFLIIDSVNKKVEFIKRVCELLDLHNCEILHTRCEDCAKKVEYREKYDYCIARGVANLSSLLEYCVGFIQVNGNIVAYKSKNYQQELDNSKNAIKLLNVKLVNVLNFKLVNEQEKFEEMERNVLIFEKTLKTSDKYPRLQNKVRNNPLN